MKRRAKRMVVRSKRVYPTQHKARESLMQALGVKPHQLQNPHHTGTYWRWELPA